MYIYTYIYIIPYTGIYQFTRITIQIRVLIRNNGRRLLKKINTAENSN